MTDTIKIYHDQQEKTLKLLSRLEDFIQQGREFGLKLPREIQEKLSNTIRNTKEDKLKIALIGGFSEGKTSIAAAWLGKLDKSTMNISAAESSNAVSVYDIGDDCQLIDTPGLYGYKEQENSSQEIEKYKDITKKYVSEAHIILYVMNPKNPIKESHKDDLIWLFKDLNLLPRTVFVLGRFDEVADVEDEADYQCHLKIKQETVSDRLADILQLNDSEKASLRIVGISANPFDEGVDYWLENPEEFRQLSHIDILQETTTKVVKENGGLANIIQETRKSIFNDIISQQIPKTEEKNRELIHATTEITDLWEVKQAQFKEINKQVNRAREGIRTSINSYFNDLIMQARGLGLETAQAFYDGTIGVDGSLVQDNINRIFQQETTAANVALDRQIVQFDTELNDIDSAISTLTRQGVGHLVKNVKLDNTMVLAARDGIRSAGKVIGMKGMDGFLKFKPYGAVNFAKTLNGALAVLGLAVQAWDTYQKAAEEEKFQQSIKQLVEDFDHQRKEILEKINSNEFIALCFHGYLELENALKELGNIKTEQEQRSQRFNEWYKQAAIIDAEFREL